MPETTPLIKAALNLRVGAGFDVYVKSHKRTTRKAKATREDQYGNLPIHKEVIPLPEEDKYCPYCNSKMEYVTEMFVREELRITPAKVERIVNVKPLALTKT